MKNTSCVIWVKILCTRLLSVKPILNLCVRITRFDLSLVFYLRLESTLHIGCTSVLWKHFFKHSVGHVYETHKETKVHTLKKRKNYVFRVENHARSLKWRNRGDIFFLTVIWYAPYSKCNEITYAKCIRFFIDRFSMQQTNLH